MHQPDYLRLKLPRTVSATSDAIKLVATDRITAAMKSITSTAWRFLSILLLFTKSDMKTILIPTVSLSNILYYSSLRRSCLPDCFYNRLLLPYP
jgi:hypothetical protein